MNITIVTDSDPNTHMIGGINTYLKNLCDYLKNKNNEIGIIGRIRTERKGNYIHYDKFTGIKSKSNYGFLLKLLKFFFKEVDSEVIIAQRADFLLPFIFKKSKKIIIYHGNPKTEISHKKGFFTGLIYKIIESISIRKADKIIVVSSPIKSYLEKKYRLGTKVVIIPPAVDLSIFKPKDISKIKARYGYKPDDKIALYVGRFSPEKQVGFIVDEISKLKNVVLVLVGEGAVKITPAKNVKVLKPVPHNELAYIINCASCLVLFSKYEGMPNTVLEALACGKPVVSSDVGDIRKAVVNGKTGFLATRSNFSKCVRMAVANSSKYKGSCIRIAGKYSWDKIGFQILKVLSS